MKSFFRASDAAIRTKAFVEEQTRHLQKEVDKVLPGIEHLIKSQCDKGFSSICYPIENGEIGKILVNFLVNQGYKCTLDTPDYHDDPIQIWINW